MKHPALITLLALALPAAACAQTLTSWATNGFPPAALMFPSSGADRLACWQSPSGPATNYFVRYAPGGPPAFIPFASAASFIGALNNSDVEYDGTHAWVSAHVGTNTVIYQYTISGSTATLSGTHTISENNVWTAGMIKSASGGLFVFWSDQVNPPTGQPATNVNRGVSYRSAAGTWYDLFPIPCQIVGVSVNISTRYSCAQHPVDGRFWNFWTSDGGNGWIHGLALTETGAMPTWQYYPHIVSIQANGGDGAEGEHPHVRAAPDAINGVIQLAYVRNSYLFFPSCGGCCTICKGAFMDVLWMDAAGNPTRFIPLNQYTERIAPFGFWLDDLGNPNILYQGFSSAGIAPVPTIASWNGFSWNLASAGFQASTSFYPTHPARGVELQVLPSSVYSEYTPAAQTVPVVTMLAPTNNASATNLVWTFTGTAIDPTDGDISAQLYWYMSNTGGSPPLCNNCNFVTGASGSVGLHPGYWSVYAVVTNSLGLTANSGTNAFTILSAPGYHPPCLAVTSPIPGQQFATNTAIPFNADVTFDGGLYVPVGTCNASSWDVLSHTQWFSSIDGAIGTGAAFTKALSAGSHTITTVATDDNVPPLHATNSLPIVVYAVPPAQALTVTVACDKLSYARHATANITATVTSGGVPVAGATVALRVTWKWGQIFNDYSGNLATDGSGRASWAYYVHNGNATIDTVTATAAKSGYRSATGGTTFTVTLH